MLATPFDPFWMLRLPLSGNVAQRFFSPALTVNYAGDAAVEDRVVAEVASYGKQIGWLNDIVLALAERKPPDADTVAQLIEAVEEIEAIKRRVGKSAFDGAVTALDRLQKEQPGVYRALLAARMERDGSERAV